jgi:hypothetical protein
VEHWANDPDALNENDWAVWFAELDSSHEDDPGWVTWRTDDPPILLAGLLTRGLGLTCAISIPI